MPRNKWTLLKTKPNGQQLWVSQQDPNLFRRTSPPSCCHFGIASGSAYTIRGAVNGWGAQTWTHLLSDAPNLLARCADHRAIVAANAAVMLEPIIESKLTKKDTPA